MLDIHVTYKLYLHYTFVYHNIYYVLYTVLYNWTLTGRDLADRLLEGTEVQLLQGRYFGHYIGMYTCI